MFAPFETLEDSARIWIYQAGRKFTETERGTISDALTTFTHSWVAHGNPLKTSFAILYDQFIVLAADENFNEASGCSIDSSVRVIRQLDQQFSLGLFDRTKIGFLKGEQIEMIPLNELPKALLEGRWHENSMFFNNVIESKGQLKNGWIIPANQTWLKRYLAKTVV
jgi:hypothetical protein